MKNIFARLFASDADSVSNVAPVNDASDVDTKESVVNRLKRSRKTETMDMLLALAAGKLSSYDPELAYGEVFQRSLEDFKVNKSCIPEGVRRGFALDGTVAKARPEARSATGAGRPVMHEKVMAHFQNRGFIGWQACAVLAQHEVINRACCIPAEDAIAHGYRIVCSSMDHDVGNARHDSDEARWLFDLKRYSDNMGMNDVCVQLDYKKKVFGVGLAIPRVKDADYEKPFNIDGIKPGSYLGFAVVDPYWLTYEFDDDSQSDPTSPSFYDPTYFRMPNGRRVHKSWVVRVVNSHVPDILKPTYYFGGIPLTQMLYERVFCADKIANEAPLLAMTKRLLIADANVEELIDDKNYAAKMMKAINYFRDNFSIFFKKPNSQVQQIDTSLGEFDQLIMTQYQLIACIAQMPATKLLKVTPTGFQSTGEYEWKDYAQALLDIQNNEYRPLYDFHYKLLIKSLYPDRSDLSVSIAFNPIDVPTKDQESTVEARVAQYTSTLIQSGVITPEEGRTLMRTLDQSMLGFLSPEFPEILKKAMEAKAAGDAGGGIPGMPGAMPGIPPTAIGSPGSGDTNAAGEEGSLNPGDKYADDFAEAVQKIESMASTDNPALTGNGMLDNGGQENQEGE